MADTQVGIHLSADGGDQVAAQIGQINSSMGMFQERMQHIGLLVFAQQMGGASVLGRELYQVVGLMNAGLVTLGETFGIATGPIGLVVTALGALAAIIVSVVEKQKSAVDSIENQIKSLEDQAQKTQALSQKLEEYKSKVGALPGPLNEVLAANKNLAKAQRALLELKMEDAVTALGNAIKKLEGPLSEWTIAWIRAKEALSLFAGAATLSFKGIMAAQAEADREIKEAQSGQQAALAQTKEKLAETKLEMEELGKGSVTTAAQWIDAHEKMLQAQQKIVEESNKLGETFSKAYLKGITETYGPLKSDIQLKQEDNKITEEQTTKLASFFGVQANGWQEVGRLGGTVVQSMAKNFGDSIGKMLVEGKSFAEEFKKAFKSMAEQVISDIVRMIIEWSIFKAAASAGFGGFFGTGGAPITAVSRAQIGTDTMVSSPTRFMAGELGPERVQVTPMYGGGAPGSFGGGGGSTSNNVSITFNVSGVNDPRELAEKVGEILSYQIRGRGQLNMTGASIA